MILGITTLFLKLFVEADVPESSKASLDRTEQDSLYEGVVKHVGKKQDNRDI